MSRPTVNAQSRRRRLLAGLALAALIAATSAHAAPSQRLDLPAGPLDAALVALATQSHTQLLFTPDEVAGRQAPRVTGDLTAEAALARLLAGSGLVAAHAGDGVLVLRPAAMPAGAASRPSGGPMPAPRDERISRRPFGADPGFDAPVATAPAPADPQAAAATVSELLVTGSHIRGAGAGPSPLVVLDRADLDRSGRTTLAEALGALPQNFSGQDTEQATATGADRSGVNAGYGTGVNLRGLGSDATLVLVNSRRLSGAGGKADFADISTLPTIAVARVELLLDGASALYGSDAVGGVVNVILRQDLDGGELRVSSGAGTSRGPHEAQVGAVLGHTWATGSLLLSYEGYRRTALEAADRRFTASADLRPLGGSDWRTTFSHPGNILKLDPATLTNVPFYAIPAGQDGTGLQPADLRPGAVNLENPRANTDILPDQRRNSGYLALRQDLGERIQLTADALYGFRAARTRIAAPTALLVVTPDNPFYVPVDAKGYEQIAYAFSGDLPPPVVRVTTESLQTSAGLQADLGAGWRAEGYGGFAQVIEESRNSGIVNSALLDEALGNVPDDPTTPYSPARDGYFNPYTGVVANSAATRAAIGSGETRGRSRSRVYTANLQADGTLFQLPAGPLKAALGGQLRRETFVSGGSNFTSTTTPEAVEDIDVARSVAAVFAELRAPLLGDRSPASGLGRLELSAAARWEHYSDFGSTLNPKLGLLWTPHPDLNLRLTYGRSYRAPGLRELHDRPLYSPGLFPLGAGRVLGLILNGGNPDLKPETATSWTAGADWRPAAIPGLELSVTGFDVRYRDRIDTPVTANLVQALSDPTLAAFVRRLDPANPQDLAYITALLADPATSTVQGSFPPESYGAVVDARYVNTGRLAVRGIDVSGRYAFDLAGGRLALAASGTDLLRYVQTLTPAATPLERAGQVGYPSRFRGRLTADWSRRAWTLGGAVNRTSAARDAADVRVDGDTTVDLRLRWEGPAHTPWSGTAVTLNVRNLFDTAPPFYDNPAGVGFDPANADLIGRFVSLQLSRSW